jgi:hypothetical protein
MLVHLYESDVTDNLTSTPPRCLSATPVSRRARPTTALMEDEDAIVVYDMKGVREIKQAGDGDGDDTSVFSFVAN